MIDRMINGKGNRLNKAITVLLFTFSSSYLFAFEKTEVSEESVSSLALVDSAKPVVLSEGHNKLSSFRSAVSRSKASKNLTVKKDTNLSITRRSQAKKERSSEKLQAAKQSEKKIRATSPQKSLSAFGFEFYSANTFFNLDLDGDGYFSDFTLEFDADYDNGAADVFAVVYYSQNGGDWIELVETEVFTIFLDEASDFYSLDLVLNNGFPTSEYDILIDLYENGVAGIVATISSDDTDELFALPLEDEEHEFAADNVQIPFVASDLFGDFDGDLFYTDLTLEYDIDAQYRGDVVYAEIILFNLDEGWQDIRRTNDFILENQTEFIDLGFNSGFTPGFYDVEISLVNAFTGETIASAGQEFSSLRSLPIESSTYDTVFDDLSDDVDVHVSSGSLGWSVLLLGLLGLRRKK